MFEVQNIDTKQSNKRNNQKSKSKARLSHEIRGHKWQDIKNLCENQRWNQVLRKGKHFLLRMRHPSWCLYVVSRNETYSWQQYHGLQMSLAMVVTVTR